MPALRFGCITLAIAHGLPASAHVGSAKVEISVRPLVQTVKARRHTYVNVQVHNRSEATVWLYPHLHPCPFENSALPLRIRVVDLANGKELPFRSAIFKVVRRNEDQMGLQPGYWIGRTINLRDSYTLSPGKYRVDFQYETETRRTGSIRTPLVSVTIHVKDD